MSAAYVDTSCLLAVVFGEPLAQRVATELRRHERLVSAELLEAELRSAHAREDVPFERGHTKRIAFVRPDRRLSGEMARALHAGYLRGADLWHVACALYLAPDPAELPFLSLDERQNRVAGALGFPCPLT